MQAAGTDAGRCDVLTASMMTSAEPTCPHRCDTCRRQRALARDAWPWQTRWRHCHIQDKLSAGAVEQPGCPNHPSIGLAAGVDGQWRATAPHPRRHILPVIATQTTAAGAKTGHSIIPPVPTTGLMQAQPMAPSPPPRQLACRRGWPRAATSWPIYDMPSLAPSPSWEQRHLLLAPSKLWAPSI